MADEQPSGRIKRFLDYLETISKILGGVSIPIAGLFVTLALHQQTESNQRAQLYANIMTGREKADSDVRAQMFSRLLDRYLVTSGGATLDGFRDRVMFLDLVQANFEEYFNARPLFTRLYEQIRDQERRTLGGDRPAWGALKQQLFEIARDTTSRQVALLVRSGHLTEDIVVPMTPADNATPSQPSVSQRIALYSTRGLTGLNGLFVPAEDGWAAPPGPGADAGKDRDTGRSQEDGRKRYSIIIRVNQILESAAKVTVFLYEDVYKKKRLVPEESVAQVRPIEFEVSYFSTPYMDNTRLFGGSRFSVIYDGCIDPSVEDQVCRFPLKASAQPRAQFKVITFDEAFLSQRDRPYVDQILEKIGATRGW